MLGSSPRCGPGGCLTVADYIRHEPEKTLLHEVIRVELVPFLVRARSEGAPVARFVDRVLPEVPIRQWVLTLPCPLCYRCAWNARLTSEVLR